MFRFTLLCFKTVLTESQDARRPSVERPQPELNQYSQNDVFQTCLL